MTQINSHRMVVTIEAGAVTKNIRTGSKRALGPGGPGRPPGKGTWKREAWGGTRVHRAQAKPAKQEGNLWGARGIRAQGSRDSLQGACRARGGEGREIQSF